MSINSLLNVTLPNIVEDNLIDSLF
jgi:hypothetical protein